MITRAQISGSSVMDMPISPALICLKAWNEKQETRPKDPTNFPLYVEPIAWAQSSIKCTPCSSCQNEPFQNTFRKTSMNFWKLIKINRWLIRTSVYICQNWELLNDNDFKWNDRTLDRTYIIITSTIRVDESQQCHNKRKKCRANHAPLNLE